MTYGNGVLPTFQKPSIAYAMSESFEDKMKQVIQKEQEQVAAKRVREQSEYKTSEERRAVAGSFAERVIDLLVRPKLEATKRSLTGNPDVGKIFDHESHGASLRVFKAGSHGSSASLVVKAIYRDSDEINIEAAVYDYLEDKGRPGAVGHPIKGRFTVADGESPAIENWIDEQLMNLVRVLIQRTS